MDNVKWMLKLLSGPHAGAEMHLEERAYRVGRSEDCDIVIQDTTLPGEAFTLAIGSGGIQLQRGDVSVPLRDSRGVVEAQGLEVREFEVYTIGSLKFCFGTATSGWPELQAPAAGSAAGKGVANVVLFIFIVASGVMVNNGSLDAGMTTPKNTLDSPIVLLPAVLTGEWGFDTLTASREVYPGGAARWLVEGYVQTNAEAAELKQRLRSTGVPYELDIQVMEHIKRSTETLLKQFKLDELTVAIGEQPGELVISGSQPDAARWQRSKALLLADIPGLTKIADRVERSSRISQPSIAIRSVSLGPIPYLVLANGHRYGLGSHVNGGFYLDTIEGDAVVLKRGRELVRYRVGPDPD